MKNLILLLVFFFFICFESNSKPLTCADCNCFRKSPCVDNPGATVLCLTNDTQIYCSDSSLTHCLYGCGVNTDGKERCLCPYNCSGHGYCSGGVTCNCDTGYFGSYCNQTDSCFGKVNGLHCDAANSSQMIACYNGRIRNYYPCSNCTLNDVTGLGFCNCPNNCSGSGICSQSVLSLGECQCTGNFVGTDCSTEYTSCSASLEVSECSNKTLVNCLNGAVNSYYNCPYGCGTNITDAFCTCGPGCGLHGNCTAQGRCLCSNGYSGEFCNKTTVCTSLKVGYICLSSSTIGYCNAYQLDDSFTLNCPYGCASRQCLCSSTNCINGDCTSIGICRCNSGWTGPNCGLLIGSTPALNATGFCASRVTGYYCDGNNLVRCYESVTLSIEPCQFGCNSTLWSGSNTCNIVECPPGFFGEFCQHSDPCVDGSLSGSSAPNQDFCVGNYVVQCSSPNATTVARIFCVNGCTGSTAIGRPTATCNCDCGAQGIGCDLYGNCNCQPGYLACPSGFTGSDCSVATNPCSGKSGVSVCQASNSSLMYCFNGVVSAAETCPNGCTNSIGCACPNDCSGNGFCSPSGGCLCSAGYVGDDCSDALGCAEKPNGLTCDSLGQSLLTCMRNRILSNVTCLGGCVDGDCKCKDNCGGHGTCRQGVCACNNGYVGDACEIYVDSDVAATFIIVICVGVGAAVTYFLIIYKNTKVATPQVEMEDLRGKNRANAGRLRISRRATTALNLNVAED